MNLDGDEVSSGIVGSMVVSWKGGKAVALGWPAELAAVVRVWRLSKGGGAFGQQQQQQIRLVREQHGRLWASTYTVAGIKKERKGNGKWVGQQPEPKGR